MKSLRFKTVIFIILVTQLNGFIFSQNEGVSIKTTAGAPDQSAMLDIDNSSKGLLIPRVSFSSMSAGSPVVSPATGLLVFNPGTGSVVRGFYYWDAVWKKLSNAPDLWSIIPSTTSDIQYFAGNVRIGNAASSGSPLYDLHVASGSANNFSCLFESNNHQLRWGSADYNGEVGAGPGNILVQKTAAYTCVTPTGTSASYLPLRYVQLYESGDYGFGVTSYGKCGLHAKGWTSVDVTYNDLGFNVGGNINLTSNGGNIVFNAGIAGAVSYMGSGGYLINLSDATLKENINNENAVTNQIMQLRPVTYNLIADPRAQKALLHGLIAQEVEPLFPELVEQMKIYDKDENGMELSTYQTKKGVSYTGLITILLKTIQEQQARIDDLDGRVSRLEK